MTMREQLIAKLADKLREFYGFGLGSEDDWRADAEKLVDVILSELREPDEAMDAAGGDRDKLGWDPAPSRVFAAMIEAVRRPE